MKKVETSLVALQKMLMALPAEESEFLLSMLTPSTATTYEANPKIAGNPPQDLTLHELFGKIHPSWLISTLTFYSEKDRSFFYGALPSKDFLKAHFNDKIPEVKLDPALQHFALTTLFEKAFGKELIPFSFLPEDRLLPIAAASHEELIKLCRFLGLFDVVIELKKVIKAAVLKNIERAFTQEELTFIHDIRNYRPSLAFLEIGLKSFEGDPDILRETILGRGLNRLAKALSRSSESLLWYILHTFDIDHAATLKRMMVEVKDNRTFSVLVDQVIYTWNKICIPSRS